MKLFAMLFLTFSALFGSALSASQKKDIEEYLTYFWSSNQKELFLNICLSEELEFAEDYVTMPTDDESGQVCEVICKPSVRGTLFSSEGYELQKIRFTVTVSNMDNPNNVSYKAATKNFYKGVDEKGRRMATTSKSKEEAILQTRAIDLTQEPLFFIMDDNIQEGIISFQQALK